MPLLDTSYNHDLIPGLRAGVYAASFRFKVLREDMDETAHASAYDPNALPERTIREAQVLEFGPVTFPAYEGATAGVRKRLPAEEIHRRTLGGRSTTQPRKASRPRQSAFPPERCL